MPHPVAASYPEKVLGRGEHAGFEWLVAHNGMGYRCGYVRVPEGHPWHGKDYDGIDVSVHGGLTYGEQDRPNQSRDSDGSYWFGFDCAHSGDRPDPLLPKGNYLEDIYGSGNFHLWTQEEVEDECRRLCNQAQTAGSNGG